MNIKDYKDYELRGLIFDKAEANSKKNNETKKKNNETKENDNEKK